MDEVLEFSDLLDMVLVCLQQSVCGSLSSVHYEKCKDGMSEGERERKRESKKEMRSVVEMDGRGVKWSESGLE